MHSKKQNNFYNFLLVISYLIFLYFLVLYLFGEYSVFKKYKMKARLDEIKRQEQALSKNVEKYKEKIKLIKDEDKIDKDLLEEIIYDMLNMTDEDYKILSD